MMNRLEMVRAEVDAILLRQADQVERRCGYVHLYGVSATALILAARRGLDGELCAVAGMLHDIATYETGDSTDHARRGAIRVREILAGIGAFSADEVAAISEAISLHSAKQQQDGPLAELLKDADVFQHYLYNPALRDDWQANVRLQRILVEMALPPVKQPRS